MEVKRVELTNHVTSIRRVLKEVCGVHSAAPLVRQSDEPNGIMVTTAPTEDVSRRVTTDLGGTEFALGLPIPDADHPRYWIALHERWELISRHKIRFSECGLRLYVGMVDEAALQLLRLEWIAPTPNPDGEPRYLGKHAGHPHWHIDRSA